MRRRVVLALIVALSSAALVACPDLSGIAGSDKETGSDAADGPALAEAAIADAPGTADAIADAGVDAPMPFCASLAKKPLFCDDFDDGKSPGLLFSLSGAVTVDTKSAVSGPGSLLVKATGGVGALAYRPAGPAFAVSGRLSYDLLYGNADGTAVPVNGYVTRFLDTNGCSFDISASPGLWQLQVTVDDDAGGRPRSDYTFFNHPLPSVWTHVEYTFSSTGSGEVVRIKVDGQDALTPTLTPCHAVDNGLAIYLTQSYGSDGEVRFDNVLFEAQ